MKARAPLRPFGSAMAGKAGNRRACRALVRPAARVLSAKRGESGFVFHGLPIFRFAVFAPTVPEKSPPSQAHCCAAPSDWRLTPGPFNVASRHQPTGAFKNYGDSVPPWAEPARAARPKTDFRKTQHFLGRHQGPHELRAAAVATPARMSTSPPRPFCPACRLARGQRCSRPAARRRFYSLRDPPPPGAGASPAALRHRRGRIGGRGCG